MNSPRQIALRTAFALLMSLFLLSVANMSAETHQPGPFEKFFRSIKHAFSNQPQHKSTTRRYSHKESTASTAPMASTGSVPSATSSPTEESNARAMGGMSAPPNQSNTRTTTRASTKKGDDFRYGIPVAGKKGFVTSPYSPDSGYIDVRGFQPGTPVKDPYSGKIILTP